MVRLPKNHQSYAIGLLLISIIVIAAAIYYSNNHYKNSQYSSTASSKTSSSNIQNYQQCVDAGYPIQASYPSVCRVPGGQSFVNPDEKVNPPTGSQTGTWCPSNPMVKSPCFTGTSTDSHPAGYTFAPDTAN